jgi:hypothetical protein
LTELESSEISTLRDQWKRSDPCCSQEMCGFVNFFYPLWRISWKCVSRIYAILLCKKKFNTHTYVYKLANLDRRSSYGSVALAQIQICAPGMGIQIWMGFQCINVLSSRVSLHCHFKVRRSAARACPAVPLLKTRANNPHLYSG